MDQMSRCRVYLMTAFEESNGSIPAMEAMAMARQVVCADLPSSREVFGPYAHYFPPNDFGALRGALRLAWNAGPNLAGAQRMLRLFGLKNVSQIASKALREVGK
jgi:glycosyltransferase involved in cell wall biosynthesis